MEKEEVDSFEDDFCDAQRARAIKTAAKCIKLTQTPYCVGANQTHVDEPVLIGNLLPPVSKDTSKNAKVQKPAA